MAKLGEGDPRWIVEAREDGTNVNGWHWTEKDVSGWARARLAALFDGLQLVSGDAGSVRATGLQSCEGDALLNVRKAKLIASYELAVKVGWAGSTAAGAPASGVLELPYIADENHDEDPELKVLLPVEDKAAVELKQAILASGKAPIFAAVKTFVSELRAGVPGQSSGSKQGGSAAPAADAPGSKPATNGSAAAAGGGGSAAAAAPAAGAAAAAAAKAAASSGGKRSLELTERFYCRAQDLFECFTVQGRIQAFTQSPATVDARPGGAFSWFGGSISGSFSVIEAPRRLTMSWRFSSWEEGVTSQVELTLEEPEPGNTQLSLLQRGIPEVDKFGHPVLDAVEAGWQAQVFGRVRGVFGWGV